MPEVMVKKSGITSIENIDVQSLNNIKKFHICKDCQNCSPTKCLKVRLIAKRFIDKFDFITDGVSNSEDNSIIVTKCNNFIADSLESRETDLDEKRKNLFIMYYGTEGTYEDALSVQIYDRTHKLEKKPTQLKK